jgi:hypothetical protein
MNLPEILPAAMYDLSRYGPSKIQHGTSLSPTTFDHLVGRLAIPSTAHKLETPKHIRLSRDLLYRILRGREETQRFLASFLEKELYSRPPSPSCQNVSLASPAIPATQPDSENTATQTLNDPCADSFYFVLLNVLRAVGGISYGRDADALFTLTQATEMLDRTDFYIASSHGSETNRRTFALNLCQPCKQDFRERVRKAREEMWSYLPMWFGLAGSEAGAEDAQV